MIVTKGIVELHGGKIYVHSDGEGCGSTFTVELPVYKVLNPQPQHSSLMSSGEAPMIPSLRASIEQPYSPRLCSKSKIYSASVRDEAKDTNLKFSETVLPSSSPAISISRICAWDSLKGIAIQPDDIAHRSELSSDQSAKYTIIGRNLRVLIVDDAKMNRRMLCRVLKSRCDVIMEAEDGQIAVQKTNIAIKNNTPFDLIIMDYHMPNIDGPHATKLIRSLGFEGLIIGATGSTAAGELDTFLSSGANHVLSKPLNMTEVDQIIAGKYYH